MWNMNFPFATTNRQQFTVDDVKKDPIGIGKEKGYDIPEELAENPQAMVQHLIQTGQVSNPMLQRIMPMIRNMGK